MTQIDPNVYIRRNRRENGTEYYELLLVYVNDVFAVIHSPEIIMKDIGLTLDIKDNKYGPPTAYLGANVRPFHMSDGKYLWSIKCDYYVVAAVQTIKDLLSEDKRELKSGKRPQKGPLPHVYKPDPDITDECDAKHMSRYHKLIGILRWSVELGSIDIHIEVVLLSQYQELPQGGHLEALYLIFHFLLKNPK